MTDFGVFIFPTDYSIQPVEFAKEAEGHGFESVFFPEHTHIPTARTSPYPGGGDLPMEYWHSHDPLVALAAVAGATETIRLGTGITLITEHDPLLMAKQVASLDVISNGRVILGIGAGWNKEEMGHHGVAFKDRWKVTRERILAMREIWTEDEAEYHGEFVDFDPVWAFPKPVQKGGPPILMGAQSKWAFDRTVEYCDGWMPIVLRGDVRPQLEELRAAADRAGRSMDTIQLSAFGVGPDEETLTGLIEAGFERLIFWFPSEGADKALPMMESYAKLAEKFS
jgi:probable F420-dependent oxidoreductase